jgi:hypothetical protein
LKILNFQGSYVLKINQDLMQVVIAVRFAVRSFLCLLCFLGFLCLIDYLDRCWREHVRESVGGCCIRRLDRMAVDVQRRLCLRMAEATADRADIRAGVDQYRRVKVPLWYNNAKSKKPIKSRFCGFGVTFFHPIPNPKRADLATLKNPTLH